MVKKMAILLILSSILGYAQKIKVDQTDSFKLFVETLENSKDEKYITILEKYDAYIKNHPDDVLVKIYKCKFIGSAYYDEYEGYDTNYEETQKCIDALFTNYPEHPEVVLYKLENMYGEEKEKLFKKFIDLYEEGETYWTYEQISKLYEYSAEYYVENNDAVSISYAERAELFNDSLDLSVLISKGYLRQGEDEKAKKRLMASLNNDLSAWELKQKGELLIAFDEDEEALKMFERVQQKDSTYTNDASFYKIYLKNNDFEKARTYLVNDTVVEWNKILSLQKLLKHDLAHTDARTAFNTYRRVQRESYYDDFFGVKRIKLFFKSPFLGWNVTDVSHIFILIFSVILLFIIPYLWILPIYFVGQKWKKKPTDKIYFDWTLKHFWLISFIYLVINFGLALLYNYTGTINLITSQSFAEEEWSNIDLAHTNLFYIGLMAISVAFFLTKERLRYVYTSTIKFLRILSLAIIFLIINFTLLTILKNYVDISFLPVLSAKEEVKAFITVLGLPITYLLIGIIVPIYEEIIFRGIVLSAVSKHVKFWIANSIQAILFALLHNNLALFIFYFIFGLITGFMVKRSKGLLVGIIFHIINNSVAVFTIYWLGNR